MDTVWRTSRPEIVQAYRDNEQAALAFNERLNAQLLEWGFVDHRVWYSDSAFGGVRHLLGVPLPDGVTYRDRKSWPEGWRVERDRGMLVPARSTKAGKAVALVWDQFVREYPSPRKLLPTFGMPSYAMIGSHAYAPAMVLADDTVWVKWSCDPRLGVREDALNDSVWECLPLSAYYVLVESGQDPFVTKENDDD